MKRTRSSLLAAFLLAAALPQGAQAASITVDGSVCTLAEAITSANNDNAAGNGCVDGSGADTITLQADVTLDADLPQINSAITIEGGGHFISGNNARRVLYIANTGNLTLNATTVKNGTASAGGGIFNSGALTLTNSTVSSNSAAGNMGGGIYTNNGTVTLNSSTVNNNTASIGAGIAVSSSTGTLNNVTISGNMATSTAGGIFASDAASAIMLNNTTVSQNTANTNWGGGGIFVTNNAAVTISSSLVSGNAAGGIGNEVYSSDGIINAASYNVFGPSGETSAQAFFSFTPGASDVNATNDGGTPTAPNAILNTTLADNGGPTQTHALVAGSPAIDLDAACSAGLTTDQRGYSRPINFKCDAGAVEYSPSFSTACGNGRDLPANTWLMTAPSCQPDPADIGSQYGDDLGGTYGSTWISYKWDAAAQQYPPPMVAAEPLDIAGIGNWLYSTNAGTLDISGTATPTTDCASCGWPGQRCFAIDLVVPPAGASRWNFVGNPFPYAVNWADVRVSSSVNGSSWTLRTPSEADASVMRKTFHRWTGSAYEPKDDATPGSIGTLLPQEAVWIKTLAADPSITKIKLLIPAR